MSISRSAKRIKQRDRLSLAVGVWLCTIPIVVVLIGWFFNIRAAFFAAVVLFLIMLLICNSMPYWGSGRDQEKRS